MLYSLLFIPLHDCRPLNLTHDHKHAATGPGSALHMRPRPCTCVLGPAHALGRRALAADARPRRCQPAHRQPAHRLCARAAPRWRSSRPEGRQTTECRARDNRHRGSPFDACHEGVGVGRVRAASGWAVRKWQWWQWGGGGDKRRAGAGDTILNAAAQREETLGARVGRACAAFS